MALKQAEILTPWHEEIEDGERSLWPLISSEFTLNRMEDITGQDAANLTPDPNIVAVLVECDESVLDAIELDSRFLILWEEFL